MAEVLHLFRSVAHRLAMAPVEEIHAITERGFEGCAHARPGARRQVLLMDIETLDSLELTPGVVKENITTRGLNLRELESGRRLRVGEALFEVTLPCEPCNRMEEIRAGLRQKLRGRRGMLCRVIAGGRIRVGDAILPMDYSAVSR